MDMGIKGRTAIVGGAGGGIGGAVAYALAAEGVKVVGIGRGEESLAATRSRLAEEGLEMETAVVDMANVGSVRSFLKEMRDSHDTIDILFNNTGGPAPSSIDGIAEENWRAAFESIVLGVITLTDGVIDGMRRQNWGRIITSTSSGVVAPIPNLGLSNALRSTLVGWSKTLASEVASWGVTCNVMLPGRIATARTASLDAAKAARDGCSVTEVVAESVATIPARRYGRVEEYAATATFLASEGASFITGSMIRVDGGMLRNI